MRRSSCRRMCDAGAIAGLCATGGPAAKRAASAPRERRPERRGLVPLCSLGQRPQKVFGDGELPQREMCNASQRIGRLPVYPRSKSKRHGRHPTPGLSLAAWRTSPSPFLSAASNHLRSSSRVNLTGMSRGCMLMNSSKSSLLLPVPHAGGAVHVGRLDTWRCQMTGYHQRHIPSMSNSEKRAASLAISITSSRRISCRLLCSASETASPESRATIRFVFGQEREKAPLFLCSEKLARRISYEVRGALFGAHERTLFLHCIGTIAAGRTRRSPVQYDRGPRASTERISGGVHSERARSVSGTLTLTLSLQISGLSICCVRGGPRRGSQHSRNLKP